MDSHEVLMGVATCLVCMHSKGCYEFKIGGYELEVWQSGGAGLGSYYSKVEMSAVLIVASYFRH